MKSVDLIGLRKVGLVSLSAEKVQAPYKRTHALTAEVQGREERCDWDVDASDFDILVHTVQAAKNLRQPLTLTQHTRLHKTYLNKEKSIF